MKWSELKEGRFYKLGINTFYITKVDVYTDNCRVEFIDYDNGKKGHWSSDNKEESLIQPLTLHFEQLMDQVFISPNKCKYKYVCYNRCMGNNKCDVTYIFKNIDTDKVIEVSKKEAQDTFILKNMIDRINKFRMKEMANNRLIEDASGKYLIDINKAIRLGCAIEKTFPTSWEEYLDCVKGEKMSLIDDTDGGAIINTNNGHILSFSCGQRAEEMKAFCKLIQLRDYWTDNYVPKPKETCYVIRNSNGDIDDFMYEGGDNYPLTFQERQTARNFMLCFGDLLEKAKHLLG